MNGGAERSDSRSAQSSCHVTLVSAYYPSHGGGIEIVSGKLAALLCQRGWTIEWLALDQRPPEANASFRISPASGTDWVYKRTGIPFPLVGITGIGRLIAAIQRARVCLIAEANFMICVGAFLAAKLLSKPILLVQHVGAPSTTSGTVARLMGVAERLVVRPMLRSADAVVFVSPVVAKHFGDIQSLSKANVIGHGIDLDLFKPATNQEKTSLLKKFGLPQDRKIACFVGRATVSKGIGIFIEIAKLRPDWLFVVIGDGPVDPSDSDLTNLLNLGARDAAEVAELYRCSDLLVLPSQSESFSLVVREALASGIRVLCGRQVLETDPGLGPFVTVREVKLANALATAKDFAEAMDLEPQRSALAVRSYLVEHCSDAEVLESYARILERIAIGRDRTK